MKTNDKSGLGEAAVEQPQEPKCGDDSAVGGPSAAIVSGPSDPMVELNAKIESLENALFRAKADFQNLQRRTTTERMEAVRFANADLMRSLLNVLDDLDRTLAASGGATIDVLVSGIKLVHENFLKALADNGLETIEAKGKPFDPAIHQALMQKASDDQVPGTVLEQVTRGYRLRDRVLRPACVVVSKAGEEGQKPDVVNEGD